MSGPVADNPTAIARRTTGSLSRRMIGIAALWISLLLLGGGFALDRVLTGAITRNFDSGLEYALLSMIRTSEIGPDGEVRLIQPMGDQRFLEPYSGLYWQISGEGHEPFISRSLWDRGLVSTENHRDDALHIYDTNKFAVASEGKQRVEAAETVRIAERQVKLPGSDTDWRFQIAQSRVVLDEQIGAVRQTLYVAGKRRGWCGQCRTRFSPLLMS